MAVVVVNQPNYTVVANGNNQYVFGPGWTGPSSPVSRFVIEGTASGWTGTATVQARLAGNSGTFVPVPYIALNSGGTVGIGPNSTATLTGSFLIEVDATEMEVALNITGFGGGTNTLTARLVQG